MVAVSAGRPTVLQHGVVASIDVEVFPVEPDRWVAVIEGPDGRFSTETSRPEQVSSAARRAVAGVLGRPDVDVVLQEDLGRPWSPAVAAEQVARLRVTWRPERRTALQRLFRRREPWVGCCPDCGHDWREHQVDGTGCSECTYEIEHDEPEAPAVACSLLPPPAARP